ncbi:MAG TPA: SAM-dependent methyltransferase [Pseudolabrys sp.]|jgi:methyltransferase (TIGR00027 family)|nr:SAM-dependent methyltransferase [Pseudolabrys sp.]
MQGQPSRTAKRAAQYRAAHQVLDGGTVFEDPYALPIIGETPEGFRRDAWDKPGDRLMRLFVAARSRFAEDCAAKAVARGVRQIVVLGAGLDTFGLRNPHAQTGAVVFEVDHPATQAWKRASIARAGIAMPEWLRFVPGDFDRGDLAERLAAAGVDLDRAAFFIWLGVVVYLNKRAFRATLSTIAQVPGGEVVFDYGEPPGAYSGARREALEARMARVAVLGEPWLSFFTPAELAAELRQTGFSEMDDLGPHEIALRYLSDLRPPEASGAHLVWARRG